MQHIPMTEQKNRGSTAGPPRKYSAWEWFKGWFAWANLLPIYLALWLFAKLCPTLPAWVVRKLLRMHNATTAKRPRDVRIPSDESIPAYMLRWWKIKRNAFFNIYVHQVFRSDDDTAHHCHPWWNFSIVLEGGYYENRILPGGVHVRKWYGPGSVLFRHTGALAHRLELVWKRWPGITPNELDGWLLGDMKNIIIDQRGGFEVPAKTLFITGPVLRRWGFHHTDSWVDAYDWDQYLAERGIVSMKMAGYAEQLQKGK